MDVSSTSCESLEYYPSKLLGLDYYFHVYNKLYIQDILVLKEYPLFNGLFAYKNHPIYKVDVIGVVVKREENSKCFIYAVDDGTGVVLCCCWKVNFYNKQGPQQLKLNIPPVLLSKVNELQTDIDNAADGYSLGDLIQVKGKIKIFRDKKEIVASIHKRIDDPHIQVFRLCELPKLYALRYDQPFQLPYKCQKALGKQLDNSTYHSISESSVVDKLKHVIFEHITQCNHIVLLPLHDLQHYCKVKDIFTKLQHKMKCGLEKETALLIEALCLIEDDGHVTRRGDKRLVFEVLLHKSKLEEQILTILNTETKKAKFSDRGCHYFHILDELHKTLPYSKLKKEGLMYCLQKLEEQSDVIRTTQSHYLPCGD